MIFSIPNDAVNHLFPTDNPPPPYLAYVEWFTGLADGPDPVHGMYRVKRKTHWSTGKRVSSVIPLSDVRRSVQLLPRFGSSAPQDWNSDNVLERCTKFYVNSFLDRHFYGSFF